MGRLVWSLVETSWLEVYCMLNFELMMRPSFLLFDYEWQETELGS